MDNKYRVRNENIRRIKNEFKAKFYKGDKITIPKVFYADYITVVDFGAYNFIGRQIDGQELIFDYEMNWVKYEKKK